MLATALLLGAAFAPQPPAAPVGRTPSAAEVKVVEHLKEAVRSRQRIVVSQLYNETFTGEAERAVLNRLFDTFFKIPLYLAQHQKAAGKPPSLAEIQEQFDFRVAGQAAMMLRIMETDPRLPKMFTRNPASGELVSVDVERILADPRFGKALERTIAGFEGREAPAWSAPRYDGPPITSAELSGKPYLLYFWFTNCPPCVRTSPLVAALQKAHAGLSVVGLNADRVLELPYGDEERKRYAKEHGLDFTLAYTTDEMQLAFGAVSVYPTLFFVDAEGTIVKHLVNQQEPDALEAAARLALE
jgi:thiol-disulfide isomerase/thioredoxin